ncbi:hypothetical protein SAMN04487943_102165 [Gracilibacillus orientalis]|uniref:DUF3278 domain-containing protein n=1 Tax=Gracilibacillus orientalis TaxID=334253 RepID=A0A1I4IM38_9BACI|nr:hypothetical protein [Gracilibacillus orientalis]SFL54871.1 hypothetical protein SAMN04487943_102165 [Gracilibacillus orientalis]
MKTWISFLLPDDEYKERSILYFYAEGAILLVIFLLLTIIFSNFIAVDYQLIILIALGIFGLYVVIRYSLSGMEYTEVNSEQAFKKELKLLTTKTTSFTIIFLLLYILLVEYPTRFQDLYDLVGLLCSVALVWFMIGFISLKSSYQKNKKLTD